MAAKVRWRKDRPGWYVVKHRDGRKTSKRYGDTNAAKRQAERDAREYNRKLQRGALGLDPPTKPKAVSFSEFADAWYESKIVLPRNRDLDGALAPRTARIRKQNIAHHLKPILGDRDVREIGVSDVEDVWSGLLAMEHPKAKRKLQRRTVEISLGTLRLILADAVARELLASNPVDAWRAVQPRGRGAGRLSKVSGSKVLTVGEREELLSAVKRLTPRAYPFVLFLAESGCRLGEAIALHWCDLDLDLGIAHLYREKTGTDTELEISTRLLLALRELRASRLRAAMRVGSPDGAFEGPVFTSPRGGPVREENFRKRVWAPAVKAAFGEGRRITPHGLRHTWTALHLAAGTPLPWLREQGGWASSKMLLDVYGAFLPRDMGGHADALERIASASASSKDGSVADPDGPGAVDGGSGRG